MRDHKKSRILHISLPYGHPAKARELFYNAADEADKLEFGGESPLTMRYELRVDISHPLGPSTGTA